MIKKTAYRKKGFSLVELLVVLAIFIIITTVVLFNQNKFSSDISISNVAYDVALQIRQAQVYGILVKEGEIQSDDFNSAYGIHFSRATDNSGVLQMFSDEDDDFQYDAGADLEVGPVRRPAEENKIIDVCSYDLNGNNKSCFSSNNDTVDSLDIVFKRPEPAAIITHQSSGSENRKGQVDIIIESSLGDKTRTVKVFSSGQISVGESGGADQYLSQY
jgi:prepilin-type N-terminal cleavage/methylation domain-containing protein